jgi:glycosyltransferase involved in cell wall biosynthesis
MAERIRLLWLIDSLNVGGAESLVIPFARRLDRGRYDFHLCCLSTIGGNPIAAELEKDNIPVHNLGARNLRDRAAFRRLLAYVREHKIDVIHAHLTYAGIWSALVSRKTGIPSVTSLHVAPSATRELVKSWRHRVMTDLRDRLMRWVLKRWASAVVMVSAALRDTYLAAGGLDPAKIRVVHNGIELQRFDGDRAATRARLEQEFGIPAGVPIAVTVSVLRPKKGVEVLIGAIQQVPNAVFLIIGDGSMREEWTALAERNGIADRIRWAGYRRDVDQLLAGADVFVHPSLDDAFPTVLLEAMAAGLPVVASNVGGIPEIVQPGITGQLVPPGDAAALAAAIRGLLASDFTSTRTVAKTAAAQRFSTAAWIERLERVYDEVRKS